MNEQARFVIHFHGELLPLVLHEQTDGGVVFRVLEFRSGERLNEADEVGERHFALPDAFVKIIDGCGAEIFADRFVGRLLYFLDLEYAEFVFPDFLAEHAGFFGNARAHPAAEFLLRLDRFHDFEPFGLRKLMVTLEHLDGRAVRDDFVDTHHVVVNAGAHAVESELRMDREREVEDGRTHGEFDGRSLRGEHGEPVLLQVHAQKFEKFHGIRDFGLELRHAVEPRELFAVPLRFELVRPVRRESFLRGQVHVLGADLHLDHLVVRTDDRRVNALVKVRFRRRDVILEKPLERSPEVVHVAEREVAFRDGFDDDADGEDIEDVIEPAAAVLHFAVDAVNILGAPLDGAVEVLECHLDLERPHHGLHVTLAVLLAFQEVVHDFLVFVRVDVFEREVFEFGFETVETETVGERRVDVERFLGYHLALLGLHVMKRAHIVEPVRDLDHDHARVLRHRRDELAVCLRLLYVPFAFALRGGNLRHGVHHEGRVFPEFSADFIEGVRCVLHHVVEEAGEHRGRVELQIRKDFRDFVGVFRVGHAAFAVLALMCIGDEGYGCAELGFVKRRILFHQHADDVFLIGLECNRCHSPNLSKKANFGYSPGPQKRLLAALFCVYSDILVVLRGSRLQKCSGYFAFNEPNDIKCQFMSAAVKNGEEYGDIVADARGEDEDVPHHVVPGPALIHIEDRAEGVEAAADDDHDQDVRGERREERLAAHDEDPAHRDVDERGEEFELACGKNFEDYSENGESPEDREERYPEAVE